MSDHRAALEAYRDMREARQAPSTQKFVSADIALAAFSGAPHIDAARFRDDLDAALDEDRTPRA